MALPAGRVRDGGIAVAAGCRRIEYSSNAIEHTSCRLRVLGPKRIECAPDKPGVDRGDRQFAEDRIDVIVERSAPFARVLRRPAWLLRSDIGGCGVREGLVLCGIGTAGQPVGCSGLDRVVAGVAQIALLSRCGTSWARLTVCSGPRPISRDLPAIM